MPLARPDKIVNIANETDTRGWIEHREFERAIILGPAVIVPLENVSFVSNEFAADLETLFIELPEDRGVVGMIGLRDVTFRDCRFENIGIAGTPESIARMREGFMLGH